MNQLHPDSFEIPSKEIIDFYSITHNHFPEIDKFVKVCANDERFWCRIISINNETQTIIASVDNDLIFKQDCDYGDIVEIKFCEIYDIMANKEKMFEYMLDFPERCFAWHLDVKKYKINLGNV